VVEYKQVIRAELKQLLQKSVSRIAQRILDNQKFQKFLVNKVAENVSGKVNSLKS